jgi:3-oxoacyl-[acyl-carrier protein] reductase
VNVRAPFFVIQRALALLGEGGRVINISSADTRVALPEELAYSMSKGAINVLSRTLAEALGPRGITVNAVAPGVTDTGKLASLQARPELEAGTKAVTALGRIGQASDIADVVWLRPGIGQGETQSHHARPISCYGRPKTVECQGEPTA